MKQTVPSDGMAEQVSLKRSIGLVPLVLYGLGVTIGAGIYVLIGETAGRAGMHAPTAFLVAAIVMAFSAATFAEFSGRVPQCAGEASYVSQGFGLPWLTLAVGASIIVSASVAAAAIGLGCAGYIGLLIDAPRPIIASVILCLMGVLAAWGIKESIFFAGLLTILEVAGLLAIIAAGFYVNPSLITLVPQTVPSFGDGAALASVLSAGLIAFFAFIGFDDVVNIVEEAKNPAKIMPWAIGITLAAVTILYFLVALVALDNLPLGELAASEAPVGLLFERLTGLSPLAITLIAIFATLNGVVIQIIMASRVAYGLARRGNLPAFLGKVNKVTRTPLIATVLVTAAVLVLALFVPLNALAEWTSAIILAVFFLVNLALIRVKWRGEPVAEGVFVVPFLVPVIGAISCLCLLVGSILL